MERKGKENDGGPGTIPQVVGPGDVLGERPLIQAVEDDRCSRVPFSGGGRGMLTDKRIPERAVLLYRMIGWRLPRRFPRELHVVLGANVLFLPDKMARAPG